MQDIFSSVRRSLVFRPSPDTADESPPPPPVASTSTATAIVGKINSCIRKSIAFNKQSPSPSSPSPSSSSPLSNAKENVAATTAIRWRKGELIGCGAFGRVYMGLNLDSGELLAVKQVLIAENSSSKEKAQTHIRELEEEVKLLKNLSHPNIVRYLGTVREEDSLNILLEFVPGGSISSLLGKFGAFPEAVVRTYTTQLLLGLEYLHKNGIMHRDIKGANILVDNKGQIKLADFGASKQVVELATITGAKSMKGTPYWMAPEVILQTGHSFSADIWSVGCTVIEMATGKPPWSQQYQEVAALFHIGTTKSHPPIPEHLSDTAKDFLLKCLQKEPGLRPTASQLLQHAFVMGKHREPCCLSSYAAMGKSGALSGAPSVLHCANRETSPLPIDNPQMLSESKCTWDGNNDDDGMCRIDGSLSPVEPLHDDFSKSFNPMSEPSADWSLGFDGKPHLEQRGMPSDTDRAPFLPSNDCGPSDDNRKDFSSGGTSMEDDDELTESKIKAFLDEKVIELKKLQTPLYEEFFNSLNAACSPGFTESIHDDNARSYLKLPPKSRSPSRPPVGTPSAATEGGKSSKSPGSNGCKYISNVGNASNQSSPDVGSPQFGDRRGLSVENSNELCSPSFSERQRMWKEELDQELERKREMMRQAVAGGKTSSPKDRAIKRQRDRTRFASPG